MTDMLSNALAIEMTFEDHLWKDVKLDSKSMLEVGISSDTVLATLFRKSMRVGRMMFTLFRLN